jgi:hypothetical protein
MLSADGPARTVVWARPRDEETRIAALAVFEQVPLALNLFADLERARQSGNLTKVAKVNRRLDRLLDRLGKTLGGKYGRSRTRTAAALGRQACQIGQGSMRLIGSK